MKIYAIPKTQTNTYVANCQQNSSLNTDYISTKNMSTNNCTAKINFGLNLKDIWKNLTTVEPDLSGLTKEQAEDVLEVLERREQELIDKIWDDFSHDI